jgi:phage gp29-like protein
MSPGLWVTPTDYVDLAEPVDRGALRAEIASRGAAWDYPGWIGLLPDPDPVLRKLPDGGVSVLEDLTGDGHLTSSIQTRKLGTLKKEFRWEPGVIQGEKKARREAVRLRDRLAADLERVDLYALLSGLLDAPLFGLTPVELLWAPGGDHLALADLVVKPARWFGFDEQNRPRFVSRNNPWDGELLPFGKFVFARHFPTYDNPYGLRLLSRCLWPVAFKRGGWQFWVTFAEKYGMPFLLGKYRPGAPPKEQNEMLSNLAKMVRDAVAVIPQGGTAEFLDSASKGASSEIHKDLIHESNAEMSKVIAGQTLTAEVGERGSYAASQTHERVLEDFRQGDQTLSRTTMEEIAWVYGQVNAPGVPTPRFVFFEEEEPQEAFAKRDETLSRAGLKLQKKYYVRRYGFEEDEIEVGAPAAGDGRGTPRAPDVAGATFAEGDPLVDDPVLDPIAEEMLGDWKPLMAEVVDPVRTALEEASSYEDALARLQGLDLDPRRLTEALAKAAFCARAAGDAGA